MENRSSQKNMTWLLYSLFLGSALALFILSGIQAEEKGSFWPPVAITIIAAILLPGLGALVDRYKNKKRLALAWGLALLILSGLNYLTGSFFPWPLVASVFPSAFIIAQLFHKSMLPETPQAEMLRRSRLDLACISGITGLMLLFQLFLSDSPAFSSSAFVILGLCTLLFLLLWWISTPPEPVHIDTIREPIAQEIQEFGRSSEMYRDAKAFLFSGMFFTAASTWLLAFLSIRIVSSDWHLSHSWPTVALLVFAAGALFAQRLVDTLGLKRAAVATQLMFAGLTLLVPLAQTANETTALAVASAVLLGVGITSAQALFSLIITEDKAGQGFGYFFLMPVLGTGAGFWLSANTTAGGIYHFLLFLVPLFFLQTVRARRAPKSPALIEEDSHEASKDMDWGYLTPPPAEMVRHNWATKSLQLFARTMAEIFFGKLRIHGRENLRGDLPSILVANHPNTFLDPLLITALAPGRVHYWAKSTLWKLPVLGSILDGMGAIPIHRRQDVGGGKVDNSGALDSAADKLLKGAHILIFPEGVSEPGLSLKPIKTGAARLGFQAMEASDWENDLRMVPIGLDYAEPTLFRTHVTIRIGEPILLKDWQNAYGSKPRETVGKITDSLSSSLKNLLPHLDNPQLENLVLQIQNLYGERILQILNIQDMNEARKVISEAVNHYQQMDPDTLFLFHQRMQTYHRERERLSTPENHAPIPMKSLARIFLGFFSFASFGLIANWIPYRLSGRFAEWFSSGPVWTATAKLACGMFTFGFYYLLMGLALNHLLGPMSAVLLVGTTMLSAIIALGASSRFAFRLNQLRTLWQAFWTQDTNEDLEAMRVSLIQDLERFRESYAFFNSEENKI